MNLSSKRASRQATSHDESDTPLDLSSRHKAAPGDLEPHHQLKQIFDASLQLGEAAAAAARKAKPKPPSQHQNHQQQISPGSVSSSSSSSPSGSSNCSYSSLGSYSYDPRGQSKQRYAKLAGATATNNGNGRLVGRDGKALLDYDLI